MQRKLTCSLYVLNTAKRLLNQNTRHMLYYSMTYPYLTYGVLLWGSASKTSLKPIEIMQKKSLRIIANTSSDAHTNILFKELKILKFTYIFKYHLEKFIFLQTNNSTFVPPIMYPNRNIDIHSYNTRHNNQIPTEFTRTKHYRTVS